MRSGPLVTAPVRIGALTVLIGLAGVLALRVDYSPSLPSVACAQVFDTPPTLQPAGASYRVLLGLQRQPKPAAVAFQTIDTNGFGWLILTPPAQRTWDVLLPAPYPIREVRIGVLAPSEASRARTISTAARSFDVRGWWSARGWAAPKLTLCSTFHVHG